MATFTVPFTIANTAGTQYIKIKYRLTGASVWTSFNIASSGTTATISGCTNDYLYDIQVVNVNGSDNPASAINQSIWITDPGPLVSPTNTTMAYSFLNLSPDIDTYTCTVAEFSTPGSIIATHILTPTSTITDTFTGLTPLTKYYLTITPAANQFTRTFTYIFTTEELALCANPSGTTATLS